MTISVLEGEYQPVNEWQIELDLHDVNQLRHAIDQMHTYIRDLEVQLDDYKALYEMQTTYIDILVGRRHV